MKKYQELLEQAKKQDVSLNQCTILMSAESIMSDQEDWDEEDEGKEIDFSESPFWISFVGDSTSPFAINSEEELKEFLTE